MSLEKNDSYFDMKSDFSKYFLHAKQREIELLFLKTIKEYGPVKRLLDIGCASGRTSIFTKKHGVEELIGIEIDPRGATIAAQYMDRVVVGDITTLKLDYPAGYFDMLFFSDVLEHLVDPWSTLRIYLEYLKPEGFVIVGLPNVGHVSVMADLVRGRFEYNETGILDSGHLRFFTQDTAVQMLMQAGLTVLTLEYRLDEKQWMQYKDAKRIPILYDKIDLDINLEAIPADLRKTYFVRKFHFLAQKPA